VSKAPAGGTADLFSLAPEVLALASADPRAWPADPGWQDVLATFWASASGRGLTDHLTRRLAQGASIFPPEPLRALALTPLSQVRVVILGQDPYHGPGQAEGLAFSVAPGVKVPPSLRNIYKELQRDLGMPPPVSGSLVGWARQGVLLLNTCLTVEQGLPASHAKWGWEVLTDALLRVVVGQARPCVYLLWGAHAQAKAPLIQAAAAQQGGEALILQANHPSPLSALRSPNPFIGCGHFSKARAWLSERGHALDWSLA
jgi:uracil-DNA glycosylase